MRLHQSLFAMGVIACLTACVSREARPDPKPALVESANEATAVQQPDVVSLEGWKAETFSLPPGFAPELPTGTESLLFAPGWRDPSAENFWSYAFVMRINESMPDAARIDDLLEKYYNGLMTSFAAGKDKDISGTPTRVDVARIAPDRYEARMHLIDAFATFKPIDVRVVVDAVAETNARTTLRIQISRQRPDHAIWRSLNAAIASILARDAVAHAKPGEMAPTLKQDSSR